MKKKNRVDYSCHYQQSSLAPQQVFVAKESQTVYSNEDTIPWEWSRMQLEVMSVVTVKYGSHKSSIRKSSPNVSRIIWLKKAPLNIDVTGYVRSSSWRHSWVIFCKHQLTSVFIFNIRSLRLTSQSSQNTKKVYTFLPHNQFVDMKIKTQTNWFTKIQNLTLKKQSYDLKNKFFAWKTKNLTDWFVNISNYFQYSFITINKSIISEYQKGLHIFTS